MGVSYPNTQSVVTNSTFDGMYLNMTAYEELNGSIVGENIDGAQTVYSDTGLTDHWFKSMSYDTFEMFPNSKGSTDINGYVGNITNDVFWNNQSSGSSAWFSNPYSIDISWLSSAGQPGTIKNDWFLNLNNATVPIAVWTGSPPNMSNLHFFYSPVVPGQSFIPVVLPTGIND